MRFLMLVFVVAGLANGAPLQLSLNLKNQHHLEVNEVEPGVMEFKTTGGDPYFYLQHFQGESAKNSVLAFEYFCPDGVTGLEVYYGPPIDTSGNFPAGDLSRAESWMPYSIDLKSLSGGR